ncbi:uncharacterized protein LOC114845072 isoform X2 [Betta splendens]|uniref:Uncharacterized protein LOC114845072 isoform X2 n=1 Tax=Betta splendens TaxID=158456 RepID=A0A6P7L246_BETSP|nr:uncharacterized protein LOC114845072 isoform X2 [Betta splendens]
MAITTGGAMQGPRSKQWTKIKPKPGRKNLNPPWTDIFYHEFLKQNPSCTLSFKYQHVKTGHSRKKKSLFFHASARRTFDGCKAVYIFTKKSKPQSTDKKICFKVRRQGEVKHLKQQQKCRPAKYLRRGAIAKALSAGVSNYYYNMLTKTPTQEVLAGNMSRSLTKDVLKKISSEVRKSSRLHNGMMLELMLTQKIIKQSGSHAASNGYLQSLQIDPFAVHLYTESGIQILTKHLKKSAPITLHLDATGSVVQKIPDQDKRVLYYALVLPGMGKDKPPLPVAELISNSHSIPTISYWLMEFRRKLCYATKRRIAQIETDHSWALINSVLLSFNKENISVYLDRAFESIYSSTLQKIPAFTVVHICSAHIMKTVAQAFGKKTADKGIKEYASFTFACLLNCTAMDEALDIFYHMCVVFKAEDDTPLVKSSKTYLNKCILQTQDTKVEESEAHTAETKCSRDSGSNSVVGKSPFTQAFQVKCDQAECDILSEDVTSVKNQFFCSGIIEVLLESYMGIFPLWSGVLLGDLMRHRKVRSCKIEAKGKTRETNCHVELWFGLVKHSILQKRKFLRPAEFVSKMFASIQGRYLEHINKHNLPLDILEKKVSGCTNTGDDQQEQWAKRESSSHSRTKSKYFNPPAKLPMPKTKKIQHKKINSTKENLGDKDAQLTRLWGRKDTEVIEGLFHVAAHKLNILSKIYILNHYTAGAILFGDRTQLSHYSLPKVNLSNYQAVLSFVLVNNNHWKMLYINAARSMVYLVDPAPSKLELQHSEDAAKKIQEFLKMRRTCHGKTDWVDIKWKGELMSHPVQQDGHSCGVIVVKMAKSVMESFPKIPRMTFGTSKKEMANERRALGLEVLEASIFDEHTNCAMCATFKPPGSGPGITNWVQCDECERWFHAQCLCMKNAEFEKAKGGMWNCVLCE